jgi:hypothetical protein
LNDLNLFLIVGLVYISWFLDAFDLEQAKDDFEVVCARANDFVSTVFSGNGNGSKCS